MRNVYRHVFVFICKSRLSRLQSSQREQQAAPRHLSPCREPGEGPWALRPESALTSQPSPSCWGPGRPLSPKEAPRWRQQEACCCVVSAARDLVDTGEGTDQMGKQL